MKGFVWILLVANLAVAGFFIGRDYWPQPGPERLEPMNEERLGLRGQLPPVSETAPTSRQAAPEALCVEWRGLNQDEFSQAREELKALVGERVMSFTEIPVDMRHWVLFPPLPSALAAAAKLDELLEAGLEDGFVVREGVWRNAISLGLYTSADAGRRRVRELEEMGVLGTRVELLPRPGTDFYFVIRSEDPDALKSLSEIRQAYPNSQQSRVACPSSRF
jgi:hypothetical protein